MKSLIQAECVIIGAGPVGLTAAMLLQRFNISHVVFEKKSTLKSHPGAHFISSRTKQIFSQVPRLNSLIEAQQQAFGSSSRYLFVERILGKEFGAQNIFNPSAERYFKHLQPFTKFKPSLLSQARLTQLMIECMKLDNVQLKTQITKVVENQSDDVVLEAIKNGNEHVKIKAKYVIACDGMNSTVRNCIGVRMQGKPEIADYFTIYFKSKKLSELLTQFNQEALLHFIYNSDYPAVLVSHSKTRGEFVLQVPRLTTLFQVEFLQTPQQIIKTVIQSGFGTQLHDLTVVGTQRWNTSSQIVESYKKGKVFLAGDAAHSLPPSGGLGMNLGIQDVHNLAHKLNIVKQNTQMQHDNKASIELQKYHVERREAGLKYLKVGKQRYKSSLQIGKELGLDQERIKGLDFYGVLPFNKWIYQTNMKKWFTPKQITKKVKFLFNDEVEFENLSKYRQQIAQSNSANHNICYYLNSKCRRQDFLELLGVQDDAIQIVEMQGQKLVRSDGVKLH